jgi:hypothetical protein
MTQTDWVPGTATERRPDPQCSGGGSVGVVLAVATVVAVVAVDARLAGFVAHPDPMKPMTETRTRATTGTAFEERPAYFGARTSVIL